MNFKAYLLAASLASVGASAAHAQIFVPTAVANGTILGGIAGALIGGHNHNNWAAGAVIGAAAGAVVGSAVDQSEQQHVVYAQPAYAYGTEVAPAATVAGNAPMAPAAPYVSDQSAVVAAQTAPQVVYQTAPQVVYVNQDPYYYYNGYPYAYGYGYPVGISVGFGFGGYRDVYYRGCYGYRGGYAAHGYVGGGYRGHR